MNLASFRLQFPEFLQCPDTFVQAHLDAALLELDVPRWEDLIDQGQAYLAAHKMALSPYGNGTKLQNRDGTTTYNVHFRYLAALCGGGGMLV